MIEIFAAPSNLPFITLQHIVKFDKDGHIQNPAPMQFIATLEVDVIPDATNETLYDLFSALPVQTLAEGFDEYEAAVLISINRESNEIARLSRRGAGNVLVGSEKALQPVNREMFLKMRAGSGEIVVNNELPDDEVIVLYKGTGKIFDHCVDGPFAYDGKNLRALPHWNSYVRRLSVV